MNIQYENKLIQRQTGSRKPHFMIKFPWSKGHSAINSSESFLSLKGKHLNRKCVSRNKSSMANVPVKPESFLIACGQVS